MNTKFIATTVIAIAAMSGASAFAQNNLYGEAALVVPPVSSTSNVTRAQVQAEYLQARQKGELPASPEAAFAAAPAAASSVTRAQVQTEYLQARQKGELPVSPEAAFAAAPSTATSVTRAEVRAQAIVAARAAQATGNSTL